MNGTTSCGITRNRISALLASLVGIVNVNVPLLTVWLPKVWTLIALLLCVEL